MSEAPKITLLAVIATEPDEPVAFAIPDTLDALDADAIAKAIAEAEEEKARRKLAESAKLHEMFLKPGGDEKGEQHDG
jgi:hypothetical protein